MNIKRKIALLLAVVMILSSITVTVFAEEEPITKDDEQIHYIDENGDDAVIPANAQIINITEDNMPTDWSVANGWYVVSGNVNYWESVVTINGTANLLLLDGATLRFREYYHYYETYDFGFRISTGQVLNIFGQSNGEEVGQLICTRFYDEMDGRHLGTINFNSGRFTGRITGIGGNITINGGIVDATGYCNDDGDIGFPAIGAASETGELPAITINGGIVTAKGGYDSWYYFGNSGWYYGVAIGGYGYSGDDAHENNPGTITINGGTVTTSSSSANNNYTNGCGFGKAYVNDYSQISLVINGGVVVDNCGSSVHDLTIGWTHYSDSYTFKGVSRTGTTIFTSPFVIQGTLVEVDESNFQNHTIVPPPLSVTFIVGKDTVYDSQLVFYGQFATEPIPPRSEGEHFVAWLYGGQQFDFDTPIVENTILYASFDANEPISYLVYNENGEPSEAVCDYYNYLYSGDTELSNFTYSVEENIVTDERIVVDGTVNLIIRDGASLTASDGITVMPGSTLNIYGQAEGTGILNATAVSSGFAGIGGTKADECGAINIHGVVINATGSSQNEPAAGIGGGYHMANGTVNIYAGEITASGGMYGNLAAAGIGGGDSGEGGTINIFGGIIDAHGGATNSSYGGAGIGGGSSAAGGVIIISGGEVTTVGGKNAAGIGGGDSANGGTITITGGVVNASSGPNGKGIGAGKGASSATIELSWTSAYDSITASSYNGTVSIISDFMLYGTQTYATITNIDGTTIVPCFTVTIEAGENSTLSVVASIPGGEEVAIESGSAVPALTVLHISADCPELYELIEQPDGEIIVTENTYLHTTAALIPWFDLTINYIYSNGSIAAPVYTAHLMRDTVYNVATPVIAHYDADITMVEGTLTSDTAITVVYSLRMGDIDDDGEVTAIDALHIMRYVIELELFEDIEIQVADMNGDGIVNASDALFVLRKAMGIV